MLNKIILMGRLVRDPGIKTTNSDIPVCKFTVAVNRPYQKDKEQKADFINVTAWRGTAEFVSKYFNKGSIIIVEGQVAKQRLHRQRWCKTLFHASYRLMVLILAVASRITLHRLKQIVMRLSQTVEGAGNHPFQIGDLNDFEEILSDGEIPF